MCSGDDGWRAGLAKCDGNATARPHVGDKCGAKAHQASSLVATDTRVHNAGGAQGQQFSGKRLGGDVAGRTQAVGVGRITSDVVKVSTEICQVIIERERLRFRPMDLLQLLGFVKCDLRCRRFQFECGVPCSALGAMEAAAPRMRVRTCGIHDVGVGHAEKEFLNADTGKKVCLTQPSVIGGAVELEKILEFLVVECQARQDVLIAVAGWITPDGYRRGCPYELDFAFAARG